MRPTVTSLTWAIFVLLLGASFKGPTGILCAQRNGDQEGKRIIACHFPPCGPIFFYAGTSRISRESQSAWTRFVSAPPDMTGQILVIDGHRTPWEPKTLSLVRAKQARDYILKRLWIEPSKLSCAILAIRVSTLPGIRSSGEGSSSTFSLREPSSP